jgi:hypothetical protein
MLGEVSELVEAQNAAPAIGRASVYNWGKDKYLHIQSTGTRRFCTTRLVSAETCAALDPRLYRISDRGALDPEVIALLAGHAPISRFV